MYAKLVLRNARRSIQDYLVYLLTITICVTLFYSFLSISSSHYEPDIGTEYDFTMLSDGMKLAICAVTLILLFLIRFVNHYMLRRKQREFALQSVMGMEQRTIGRLFFAETFLMGLVSIAAGIFLGVFCSQFITALLLASYGKQYEITWTLFPDTVLLTAGFFILSFLVVGLSNTRAIRRMKIIDMLTADRENGPALRKSRWIWVLAIFFEVFSVWMCVTGVQKVLFYWDSRFALPVQLMFGGNILFPAMSLLWPVLWMLRRRKGGFPALLSGLLLCSLLNSIAAASVPALNSRYLLALGGGGVNQYLLFVLVDLIFLICALLYLASSFLVAWKEGAPEHRYQGENLFFFGQIISKLSTTSKTMSLTCVTLVLAIFLFIAAPVLVGWASGYLDERSMYDVQIFSRYNDVYEEADLPDDNYDEVTAYLAGHHIPVAGDCAFSLYLPERADFHNRVKYEFPVVAIALSDYNAIREMLGYAPIALADGEFATQWKAIATEEERDSFLREHPQVRTDAGTLTLSAQPFYEDSIGETAYNSYTDVLYIFPDSVCEQLLPVMRNRYITTEEAISYDNARELEQAFTGQPAGRHALRGRSADGHLPHGTVPAAAPGRGPVPLSLLRPAETGRGRGTHRKAGAPAAWSVVWASHRRSDPRLNGGDRLFPADRVRGDRRLHRVRHPDGTDRCDGGDPDTAADLLFSQHLAAVQKGHRDGARWEGASRMKAGGRLRQAGRLLRMLLSSQPIKHIIRDRIGASRNR